MLHECEAFLIAELAEARKPGVDLASGEADESPQDGETAYVETVLELERRDSNPRPLA